MLDQPGDTGAALPRRLPAAGTDPPGGEPASRLQLGPVLGVLRARRWALLLPVLVTPMLALVAVRQIMPRYTATGTALYEPSEFAARELQSILRVDPTTDAVMASQVEIVRSLPAAERLAEEFNLFDKPEFNWRLRPLGPVERVRRSLNTALGHLLGRPPGAPGQPSAEAVRHEVAKSVQGAITVRNLKATRVMEVSFTTEDQALAAKAANRVVDLYIGKQLDEKFEAVRRATGWLQTRVGELRAEVQAGEDRIAAYKAQANLVQGVQAGLDTEQISRLNADLLQARAELAQAQGRLDVARGRTGAAAQAAVSPSVVQLRAQQEQLTAQLHSLMTRLGAGHPDAVGLRHQLDSVQRAVAAETGRVVAASEAEVRAGRARVAALERSLAEAQVEVGRSAQAQVPLHAMQRDVEASRTLLRAILERIQQTAQQAAIELPDARVISPALPPGEPSFPKLRLMLAAAGATGVLAGLLLVWLMEWADSTFRSGEDVRARLGLPCFALVPEVRRRALRGCKVEEYGAHRPLSPFAEQLRALRAGLWLRARQPKVVAVTAARPGEGKTTVAMALGRSAAINGERVLVVDCDIRQPQLAKSLRADAASGLVDCLQGHAELDEVVKADELTSARFVPAGSADANTTGLFASEAMAGLLHRLRESYDLVILDAPPALAMTDALLLAHLADATLLCVRWRHTPLGVVRNALELLEEAQAHVAGVALTRVDVKAHVRAGFADSEVYHPRYGGYFRE